MNKNLFVCGGVVGIIVALMFIYKRAIYDYFKNVIN